MRSDNSMTYCVDARTNAYAVCMKTSKLSAASPTIRGCRSDCKHIACISRPAMVGRLTPAQDMRVSTLRTLRHRVQLLHRQLQRWREHGTATCASATVDQHPQIIYAVSAAAEHDSPGVDPTPPPFPSVCRQSDPAFTPRCCPPSERTPLAMAHTLIPSATRPSRVRRTRACDLIGSGQRGPHSDSASTAGDFLVTSSTDAVHLCRVPYDRSTASSPQVSQVTLR